MRRMQVGLRYWVITAATVCLAQTGWGADVPAKPVDGKIKWLPSYEEGKKEAGKTGKPLFVVFRCER